MHCLVISKGQMYKCLHNLSHTPEDHYPFTYALNDDDDNNDDDNNNNDSSLHQ